MTRQEEIREGMARMAHINGRVWAKIYHTEDPHNCRWEELEEYHRELYRAGADIQLESLASQGAVLKVEKELPETYEDDSFVGSFAWHKGVSDLKRAGYVAVEPLIEHEKPKEELPPMSGHYYGYNWSGGSRGSRR